MAIQRYNYQVKYGKGKGQMKNIKKETFLKVSREAISRKGISRDGLAEVTSLSSVTVGKVVSALVNARLLTEERAPVSRGRHALLLSPSEHTVYLALFVSTSSMLAVAESASGKTVLCEGRPYNHAVDLDDNIRSLLATVLDAEELENRIGALALICDESQPSASLLSFSPAVVLSHSELIKMALANKYKNENVLYVKLADSLHYFAVSHGNLFLSRGSEAPEYPYETQSEAAENIASVIGGLARYSSPECVIIEGSHSVSSRLPEHIMHFLVEREKLSADELPHLICYENMELSCDCVFRMLTEKHITSACEEFFRD